MDLSVPPVVRGRDGADGPIAEVVLRKSSVTGPAVWVVTDRIYLKRIVELGFGEIQIISPDKPLVCRDAKRIYLWMPLDKAGGVPSSGGPASTSTTGRSRTAAGVISNVVMGRASGPTLRAT